MSSKMSIFRASTKLIVFGIYVKEYASIPYVDNKIKSILTVNLAYINQSFSFLLAGGDQ